MSAQQERTWSKGWVTKTVEKKKYRLKEQSIILRNILLEPHLYLAFGNLPDAEQAAMQSICLCRNEDILFPEEIIMQEQEAVFDSDAFPGFELLFVPEGEGFKVGHNRFADGAPMFGNLKIFGEPIRKHNNL